MPQNSQGRIVLIDHHDNPPEDRVNTHLKQLGYALDYRRPADGDALDATARAFTGDLKGSVIFGGLHNVSEIQRYPFLRDEIAWIRACHARGIPLLGICLGAQLIAHALGAEVAVMPGGQCEFGYYPIQPTAAGASWMPRPLCMAQAHCHQFDLPRGATLLATGEACVNQAFRCGETTYAVQFHPEVTVEIFQRWQTAEWAFFDAPGAQTREQQNALLARHDAAQHAWFTDFLERLLVRETC